jgi:flagellar biosynthesis chaperone FliJ
MQTGGFSMMKLFTWVEKLNLFLLITFILSSILLSACGMGIAESELTVYKDKYKMETVIYISSDQMQIIGGPQVFEQALDEYVTEAKSDGVRVTWRDNTKNNAVTHQYQIITGLIEIKDQQTSGFSWQEIIYNNRKAFEFRYSPFSSLLSGFQSHTFTLHAGKILESNGTQLDSKTVTWVNPAVIPVAVVIPKGSNAWLLLVIAVALFLVAGFFIYKLIVSKKLINWSSTVFNVGKWKLQETRLAVELKTLEQDKDALIKELGHKTWQSRIFDSNYTEPYTKLEDYDQQLSTIKDEKKDHEVKLQEIQRSYAGIDSHYSKLLTQLQSEIKDVNTNLGKHREEQNGLENELGKLEKERID